MQHFVLHLAFHLQVETLQASEVIQNSDRNKKRSFKVLGKTAKYKIRA